LFAPDDSVGTKHSECPEKAHALFVIGTPRRDTAEVMKMSSRGRVIPASYRWVRVLETVFTADGSSITVSDYLVDSAGGTWRVLRRIEVMAFD
jgi:hypothetical protein